MLSEGFMDATNTTTSWSLGATGGQGAGVPAVAAPAPRQRRVTLSLKTVLGLLVLLIAAITLCGVVFVSVTRKIVHEAKREQLQQFAYGLAATLGNEYQGGTGELQRQLAPLERMTDLDFVAVTNPNMQIIFSTAADARSWGQYQRRLSDNSHEIGGQIGQVQPFDVREHRSYVIAVPIFAPVDLESDGPVKSTLLGYLHLGSGTLAMDARIRYLEGAVILTCMLAVLLTLPMALVIARHITVPIQKLAYAAHAVAQGKLSHRVFLHRSDELGELAEAFNTMARTVEEQQEDIRQINAGLEAKVHDRTAELEKLNRRMQAEVSEKEDFLRAVSHDLNAPLRNISGMASMIMLKYASTLEGDAVQRLERIQKNVEVECELINELLELSRIKTRREKIEAVDLQGLVGTLVEQFSNDLETRGITLRVMNRLPVMQCEKSRLRQVFQNLIDNAIKYMRDIADKEIKIGMASEGEEVVFHVSDNGMGVAAEDLPNLFHVFRRAKNATMMKIPGKGVGLASVKSIVENYNGRLWAQSEAGVGTTFYFAIPATYFQKLEQEVAA